jgi:hypothetical protein
MAKRRDQRERGTLAMEAVLASLVVLATIVTAVMINLVAGVTLQQLRCWWLVSNPDGGEFLAISNFGYEGGNGNCQYYLRFKI